MFISFLVLLGRIKYYVKRYILVDSKNVFPGNDYSVKT